MTGEGRPAEAAPLRPSPLVTGDRRSRRVPPVGPLVAFSVSSARSRTMFSMPLAYPSTLDHRPLVAHVRSRRRPTWRSFGARTSCAALEKRKLKQTLIASVYFQHNADETDVASARNVGVLSVVSIVSMVVAASEDRSNIGEAQGFQTKI